MKHAFDHAIDPFSHILIDAVFPDDFYAELLTNLMNIAFPNNLPKTRNKTTRNNV